MDWTPEQEAIIYARGCELLVSAAAGSGKTAVLVERIFSRIMDEKDPVDIDRFVVVTFTKAAAAEMKERLRKRIEDALKDDNYDNKAKKRLRGQMSRIPAANISTVHSFCNYVIGQYFYRAGLDPAYREAEDSEMKLIRAAVMDELLETEYREENKDFVTLASQWSLNKKDDALGEWIETVYDKSRSEPFPDLKMKEWKEKLETSLDSDESPFLSWIIESGIRGVDSIRDELNQIKKVHAAFLSEAAASKKKYVETIDELISAAEGLITIRGEFEAGSSDAKKAFDQMKKTLDKMETNLSGLGRSGLPKSTKDEGELGVIVGKVAEKRAVLDADRESYFSRDYNELEKERGMLAETCATILRLAERFGEMYAKAKRERGVIDFSDLEQYALQILFDKDEKTGKRTRSETAKELEAHFREIMIDEYQDSNRVQDTILWAIAESDGSEESGKPPWECTAKNRFMVGDIKQSIYRFNNACPGLIEHKMDTYSTEPGALQRRFNLDKNFRSRQVIIDATNAVFKRIMKKDIGGVEYDNNASLKRGLKVTPTDYPTAEKVYVKRFFHENSVGFSRDRAEAVLIAHEIHRLVKGDNPLYVERKEGGYERVRYRDIVVLSRAVKSIADTYVEVFHDVGIPFVIQLSTGFFKTREISLMSQFLTVIDNPRQDIPLAGVLLSPVYGLDENMLSKVRIELPYGELYDAIRKYAVNKDDRYNVDSEIQKKLQTFLEQLERFRDLTQYTSLTDLIETIYRDTDIYDMFAVQSDSDRRCANLDALMQKVIEFDRGSFHGVHAFVEYLSQIEENELDDGEALTIGEDEDVVRMMTIHKSKGLEFPVVFLARATSEGQADTDYFRFDDRLGMAAPIANVEEGWKKDTLIGQLIQTQNTIDDIGERFRLLYVAMTRARDQLYIMRRVTNKYEPEVGTSFYHRLAMKAYSYMIAPAIADDPGESIFVTEKCREAEMILNDPSEWEDSNTANNSDTSPAYDGDVDEVRRLLREMDAIEPDTMTPPMRVSVSELKLASMMEPEEEQTAPTMDVEDAEDTEEAENTETPEVPAEQESGKKSGGHDRFFRKEDDRPEFMKEARTYTAAERGTIYHQVMATIDFASLSGIDPEDTGFSEAVGQALERVVENRHLHRDESGLIETERLVTFFKSELGQRMIRAAVAGTLKREQPFVMNKPAAQINPDKYAAYPDTPVMIQGIIDGYFEEEDGIVLMDYKTDKIPKKKPEVLVDRYHVQMELYREALERLLDGKRVKECYLYSFHLGCMIPVELGDPE